MISSVLRADQHISPFCMVGRKNHFLPSPTSCTSKNWSSNRWLSKLTENFFILVNINSYLLGASFGLITEAALGKSKEVGESWFYPLGSFGKANPKWSLRCSVPVGFEFVFMMFNRMPNFLAQIKLLRKYAVFKSMALSVEVVASWHIRYHE